MMGLTLRELCSNVETEPARWFALTVKHQHERAVQAALESKKMTALVPLYRSRQQWSDRVKEIEVPLFSGYVLCRFSPDDRIRVLDTPGVRRIVGFGDSAVPGGRRRDRGNRNHGPFEYSHPAVAASQTWRSSARGARPAARSHRDVDSREGHLSAGDRR